MNELWPWLLLSVSGIFLFELHALSRRFARRLRDEKASAYRAGFEACQRAVPRPTAYRGGALKLVQRGDA